MAKKGDKIKVTFYGSSSHVGFEGSEDEVYGGQGNEIIYGDNPSEDKVTLHTVIESNAVVTKESTVVGPSYNRGEGTAAEALSAPIVTDGGVDAMDFVPEKSNTTK